MITVFFFAVMARAEILTDVELTEIAIAASPPHFLEDSNQSIWGC